MRDPTFKENPTKVPNKRIKILITSTASDIVYIMYSTVHTVLARQSNQFTQFHLKTKKMRHTNIGKSHKTFMNEIGKYLTLCGTIINSKLIFNDDYRV